MESVSVLQKIPSIGLLFFFAAVMGGCAAGSYGNLQAAPEVTRMFEASNVPGQYQYYSIGRSSMPYAIIGIAPSWHLESRFWEAVAPNSPEFAGKVSFVWDPQIWYQFDSGRGAWILDPDGNRIGIWYSMYPHTTVVVDKERHRVTVYSPHRMSDNN